MDKIDSYLTTTIIIIITELSRVIVMINIITINITIIIIIRRDLELREVFVLEFQLKSL